MLEETSSTPEPTTPRPAESVAPSSHEKKSRRGRAVKKQTNDGKTKAEFVPGSAAGPVVFDVVKLSDRPLLYWEADAGDSFLVENRQGSNGSTDLTWNEWPKEALKSLLRREHCIALKARDGEFVSEFEQLLLHVRQNRVVDLSTSSIAGYPSGLHEVLGKRLLVRRSAKFVKPTKGDCSGIRNFVDSRLNLSDGGAQQADFFYGWCRASLEAQLGGSPGKWRPGQCLIFAGPSDCGKSRLQHNVITPLLGGRTANPGPYLFGATDFNAELGSAEHLLIEDPASGTRNFDRVYFGEMLKQFIVAETFRLHGKRENAVTVCPFFRLSISVNDDPDKMRVLPLLTPDMREKVMLFEVSAEPIPFPLSSMEERSAFVELMRAQMPAFAWWLLNEFKLPENLFHKRYGVRQWLHPALAMELFDDTPAAELLAIMDAATWGETLKQHLWERESDYAGEPGGIWEGTALALERLLGQSSMHTEAERLMKHNKLDRLLARLEHDEPDRVIRHRTKLRRGWMISRPPEEE